MTEQRAVCPECGGAMTPIMYGLPSHAAFESAERGEIVLGGCVKRSNAPMWECTACRGDSDLDIPSFLRE